MRVSACTTSTRLYYYVLIYPSYNIFELEPAVNNGREPVIIGSTGLKSTRYIAYAQVRALENSGLRGKHAVGTLAAALIDIRLICVSTRVKPYFSLSKYVPAFCWQRCIISCVC